MNLVTIPYTWSTTVKISPRYELIAYEIIHPSLQSKTFSDTICIGLAYLLSVRTKDRRHLKSHLRQFRLEGRVHIQQRCLP
jgi:hypothetical protein